MQQNGGRPSDYLSGPASTMIAGPEGSPSADSQRCESQAGRHRACRIGAGPRRTYPICWLDIHKQQKLDRRGYERALRNGGLHQRECPRLPMNLARSASYATVFGVQASRWRLCWRLLRGRTVRLERVPIKGNLLLVPSPRIIAFQNRARSMMLSAMCRSTARVCGPLSMRCRAASSFMTTSRHQGIRFSAPQ
jgi:hypothetical protein